MLTGPGGWRVLLLALCLCCHLKCRLPSICSNVDGTFAVSDTPGAIFRQPG